MTTLDEATELVYQKFEDEWGITTVFTFENEQFDEPDEDPWARVSVRQTIHGQSTLGKVGNRRYLSVASVFVQVYTRVNTGVQQGGVLAKQAADIYEGTSFSGLRFTNASTRPSGPDGKWYQHLMEAEFDYEETK